MFSTQFEVMLDLCADFYRTESPPILCLKTSHYTTRKVAMADEVEVAPWLLVHHGRRFVVSPLCMSKRFFFSFLRPPSPTKTAKTLRMVNRDVVHLEFSGSPVESTQIRTAEGCRAQMAASLALFFF